MKVRVTKIRSTNGKRFDMVRTMEALGLHKMNSSREHELTPSIKGMLNKVHHLVKVEDLPQE